MRLKQRVGDFRVRELLVDGYVDQERGQHRVYRVTKRKLTTPEAARTLANEAGVDAGDVGTAGWKDRQGITTQHMSVPRGRDVKIRDQELVIEPVGYAGEPLESRFSRGNAFEIVARDLVRSDVHTLRRNVALVRESGLVNYFDDQRFGNLKHGQGWVALELMRGNAEGALRSLLTGVASFAENRERRLKEAIDAAWGDWRECRDLAGKLGRHHSIFEHLGRTTDDFAGAFYHVATRERLIHLYAWQSHVWNRAVADLVRAHVPVESRVVLDSEEGPLPTYAGAPPEGLTFEREFPLPGEGLDGVPEGPELDALEEVLARERLVPDRFRIDGVPGFQLKPEARALLVRPMHLRVRPPADDGLNRRRQMVKVRFELPRGAYATLVLKRLFAQGIGEREERDRERAERRERFEAERRDDRARDDRSRGGVRRDERHGGQERGYGRGRDERGGGERGARGGGRDDGHRRGASGGRGQEGRRGEWRGGPGGGRGRDDERRAGRGGSDERRGGTGGARGGSDERRGGTGGARGGHGERQGGPGGGPGRGRGREDDRRGGRGRQDERRGGPGGGRGQRDDRRGGPGGARGGDGPGRAGGGGKRTPFGGRGRGNEGRKGDAR